MKKIKPFLIRNFLLAIMLVSAFSTVSGQEDDLVFNPDSTAKSQYLIFHISGDGGMRGFDVKFEEALKTDHFASIILNSLHYFWSPKTPDRTAADFIPVITDYMQKWNKKKLILSGYSFGAEVVPFLYNRLPDSLKEKVSLLVMLTPASTSDFTIHVSDMMGVKNHYDNDVVKEIGKIKDTPVLVIFGRDEDTSFPTGYKQANVKIMFMDGGHHFTDAPGVIERIISELTSDKK